MAGIGQAMAGARPGADATAGAMAASHHGDDVPNVSPEEQADYDRFVGNGRQLVYDDAAPAGVDAGIIASLRATGDPVQDLAMTAASLVTGLIENAAAAGHRIDPDIAYHGGVELLEDLADLAGAAGIHDFAEKDLEAAMYRAMDLVLKNDPGAMVDRDSAGQQFGELVREDRAGTLAQTMPVLARAIDGAGRAAEEGRPAQAGIVEGTRR